MQQIALEMAKLEAEVKKISSDAALNIAKVQDVSEVQPQLEIAKMQAELQQRMAELNLRMQLSEMSNQTSIQQSETNAATRIAATAMQTSAKKQAALAKDRKETPRDCAIGDC